METEMKPIVANLVCGALVRNHDFDFARIRLAEAIDEAGDIHANVWNDYSDPRVGDGEVLYLGLGHCNRPYDKPPTWDIQPDRRGPWNDAIFQQMIQRCVAWAARREFD